jgi:serine/threonine-protein kinase
MAPKEIGPRGTREVTFIETLGKGGFGSVYLADVRSEDNFVQRIAVKVLNAELSDESDIVARQRDEARILAQLNHEHIVKVFDLSQIHGRPAVFMEYVEGVDAGRLLQGGSVPPRAALEIGAAVASALQAAWCTLSPMTGRPLHVVHRDIKPSNILISKRGGVKVLDFGIARADFDREGQTRTHQFGTARYMAPEQWLGGTVGPPVDIYALGITILELVSGNWVERLPLLPEKFEHNRLRLVEDLRDPRWGAVWWREFSGLLLRMVSLDPTTRPSAEEVETTMLDLSEQVGGDSLRRLARSRVAELQERRRERDIPAPLVSSTDTWHHTAPEPSILTDSKGVRVTELAQSTPAPSPRLQLALMAVGILFAVGWMVSGWMTRTAEQQASAQAEHEPLPPRTAAPIAPTEAAPEPTEAPALLPVAIQPTHTASRRRRSQVELIVLRLDSVPPGAQVRVDGRRVGRTPIPALELELGEHQVQMRSADLRGQHTIQVRAGGPTHFTWYPGPDQWSSGF